jgi:hypothetical protein
LKLKEKRFATAGSFLSFDKRLFLSRSSPDYPICPFCNHSQFICNHVRPFPTFLFFFGYRGGLLSFVVALDQFRQLLTATGVAIATSPQRCVAFTFFLLAFEWISLTAANNATRVKN